MLELKWFCAICVSRGFDLTKGLLFDTFVLTVWYKLCRCDDSVFEFKSFKVFTTNELVDRIRNLKWNASQNDQEEDSLWKECAAGQILYEIKFSRRQDLSNKVRHRPDFLTKFSWVLCPVNAVCHLFSTNHSSESSSLN